MDYQIEFKPHTHKLWSKASVSTIEKMSEDCEQMSVSATVLESSGESATSEMIGSMFAYQIGTGPNGYLETDPNPLHRDRTAGQRMLAAFKEQMLTSGFEVRLVK